MNQPLSYLELSRARLVHNAEAFRRYLHPKTKLGAVVKANGYGHGQAEVTGVLEPLVDYFLVDDIEELRLLRQSSQKNCLVLGYIPPSNLEEAIGLGAELAIYDTERLPLLQKIAEQVRHPVLVHLKIDAFLGRQGILVDEVGHFAESLHQYPDIQVVAAYSHFANIEDTSDFSHAEKQLRTLEAALTELRQHGFPNIQSHISATSGVMVYEKHMQKHLMARIGIGLYGMYPSPALAAADTELHLQPIVRWVSHLAQVKTVPAGFPIGYGLTFVTEKESKIAIVPQGYSDGYDRVLSNKSEVLIQGTRCPVRGRIAMNMFAVDVSHLGDVRADEEVVLLGEQGSQKITAEELADHLGTINYEITARLSALLPRVLV